MTQFQATTDYEGATKPTSVEKEEHDSLLSAKRVSDVPTNLQMRVAYTGSGLEEYIGFAGRGVAASTASWLLHKFTYDGSNRLTLRQIAYDSWDNRASATYA